MIKKIEIKYDKELQKSMGAHGYEIIATKAQLKESFGEPRIVNSGDGKVNYSWDFVCTNDRGETYAISVYDYKISRIVTDTAKIRWSIGAKGGLKAQEFADYVKDNYHLDIEKKTIF